MSKELDDNTPGEELDAIYYKKRGKMMSDGNKNNNMMSELFAQKINKQGIIGKMRNFLFTRKSNGKKNKMINVSARAGSRRNKTNRRRRKITHRRNKPHRKSTRRRHRKY
jgi:hypothetical protein